MGFNKRYIDKKVISEKIIEDINFFKTWLDSSDAFIIKDEYSEEFLKRYMLGEDIKEIFKNLDND